MFWLTFKSQVRVKEQGVDCKKISSYVGLLVLTRRGATELNWLKWELYKTEQPTCVSSLVVTWHEERRHRNPLATISAGAAACEESDYLPQDSTGLSIISPWQLSLIATGIIRGITLSLMWKLIQILLDHL